MKHLILSAIFSFALVAAVRGQTPAATPATNAPANADNTARNSNDNKPGAQTADQQPNNGSDLKLVAEIRKEVIAEKPLSTNAKNCKIVVTGGMVTLRGPVDSAQEKKTIVEIATRNAGSGKVTDELEVKTAKQ